MSAYCTCTTEVKNILVNNSPTAKSEKIISESSYACVTSRARRTLLIEDAKHPQFSEVDRCDQAAEAKGAYRIRCKEV